MKLRSYEDRKLRRLEGMQSMEEILRILPFSVSYSFPAQRVFLDFIKEMTKIDKVNWKKGE